MLSARWIHWSYTHTDPNICNVKIAINTNHNLQSSIQGEARIMAALNNPVALTLVVRCDMPKKLQSMKICFGTIWNKISLDYPNIQFFDDFQFSEIRKNSAINDPQIRCIIYLDVTVEISTKKSHPKLPIYLSCLCVYGIELVIPTWYNHRNSL